MKPSKTVNFLVLITVITLTSCSGLFDKDEDNDNAAKGLVWFKTDPYIQNNTLYFSPKISFSASYSGPFEIEYLIKDGSSILENGKASASVDASGIGIEFHTAEDVSFSLTGKNLSGKTLVVHLDPDNKITDGAYTSDTYIDLYKIEEIVVP